jgi:hypothetical protein
LGKRLEIKLSAMPKLKIKLKTADARIIILILNDKIGKGSYFGNLHKLMCGTIASKLKIAHERAKDNMAKAFSIALPMEYAFVLHGVLQIESGFAHYVEHIPQQITSYLQIQNALP